MKMKTLLFALAGLLAMALGAAPARAQNTTAVSASHIQELNGTPLASGLLCLQGTDQNNAVISFQQGGGGPVVTTTFCATVTNGAVTAFNVPNPASSAPLNVRYHITVVQGTRTVENFPGVYLCNMTGACTPPYTFNFDNCLSSGACMANPIPIVQGAGGGGGGLFGMTAGQIPLAATATTVTSSVATSGSGSVCLTTSCVMTTPNLGTPSAINLTNATSPPTWNQNTTGTAATITGALALTNTPLTTTQDILFDNAGALGRLGIVTSGKCLGNTAGAWASLACSGGGSGTLTASGASLPVNQIVLGNTYPDTKPLGSLGTTTTLLHGNAAGAPTFAAVALATDVSGQLPIGGVGSAGLSGTAPIGVASTGAVSCATCVTSAAALTSNAVVIGGGLQASSAISADTTTTHALFATAGAPAFRAIATGDIPTLNQNTSGTAATITGALALANTPLTTTQDILFDNAGALGRLGIVTSGTCLGNTAGAWAAIACGGNGVVNTGTQYAFGEYATAGTTISSGPTPPAIKGQYSCGYTLPTDAPAAPTCPQIGVAPRPVTGATSTDTILFTDNNTLVDYQGSAAVAVALPTPTTLENPTFFVALQNNTSGSSTALTVTATTLVFQSTGTTTLTIPQGQACSLYVDPNGTQWDNRCGDLPFVAGSGITITRGQYGPSIAATAGGTGTLTASGLSLPVNQIVLGNTYPDTKPLGSLGTTTTILHGNAAGAPTFGSVVSGDLNITTTSCTNQFLTAISAGAAGTCTTDTLAGAQHANQGTTTTLLHGNGAGNPAWGAVALATDVSGQLPIGNVGSAGLSGTTPIGVASTGAVSCATCVTSAAALTSNAVVIGGGLQASSAISTDTTTTHVLFATATAPAFRAISTGDLPNIPINQMVSPNGAIATFAMGNNTLVHNYALTTASASAFTIGETTAATSTGTPFLLNIQTLAASTLNPLVVTARGTANGVQMDAATGLLHAIGTGAFGIGATAHSVLLSEGATTAVAVTAADTTTTHALFATATDPAFRAIASGDIPTLNQNTSGTAANLSGTPALPNGTTATTQAAASADTKLATDAYVDGHFIASGTAVLNTALVASGACETVVTVSATGVATTDVIGVGFNGDPTAITGYGASATGAVLSIYPYPTTNNVNMKVCNSTSGSITPSAMTLNWKVTR